MISQKKAAGAGGIGETIKVIVQALLLAFIVRTFLFQPFNIPSGSMKDTLLVGDYLFVSKFSYGFSRYSMPFGEYLPGFGASCFLSHGAAISLCSANRQTRRLITSSALSACPVITSR